MLPGKKMTTMNCVLVHFLCTPEVMVSMGIQCGLHEGGRGAYTTDAMGRQ